MRGRIPQAFIDNLIARSDLAELIGSRITLKRTGKNYSALCPFHNEKSPSFSVNPDKQFYYCFGCGAGGNALKFLMEYDNLEFVEAIESLARIQGVEVERTGGGSSPQEYKQHKQQQDLRQECMQAAVRYFQANLSLESGQAGLNYLSHKRQLSPEIQNSFLLGVAIDSWDGLKNHLSQQGFSLELQEELGLITHNQEQTRTYDRFRNRVVFPIRNLKGHILGFGGRVLDDSKPKYLNSPETPIFQKSQELYGLYEARQQPGRLDKLLVVEGYMDVVALAQKGIHWAVATLGTAASQQHLESIFRLVNEVVFCFDGDAAGLQAAARAMQTLLPLMHDGRHARFLFLPNGEDPDSLVNKEGAGLFEQRVNYATPLAEYLINYLSQGLDLNLLDDQARMAQAAQPLINSLAESLLKQRLIVHLEQITGLKLNAAQAPAPRPVKPLPTAKSNLTLSAEAKLIGILVRHPSLISEVNFPLELTLENNADAQVLQQLLEYLNKSPYITTQVLLAYWAGTPQGDYFLQRAQQAVELNKNEASTEVNALVTYLGEQAALNQAQVRYQHLLNQHQTGQISAAEQQELWQLIQQQHLKS